MIFGSLILFLLRSAHAEFIPEIGETYVEYETGRRMIVYRGETEECRVYGDPQYIRRVTNLTSVTYVDGAIASRLLSICEKIHLKLMSWGDENTEYVLEDNEVERRIDPGFFLDPLKSIWSMNVFNSILIFPGTKWCGQGAVAEHYDDIGYHGEADRCCRSHDLCLTVTGEYLSPGDCKNGLCNYSPVTRSPCQCDRQFVHCLRSAKTKVANALGRLFFNIAGLTCYKYEHPVKRCSEFAQPQVTRFPPWLLSLMHINPTPKRPRCKRYELDKSKPKIWQFFETFYEENNDRSEEPRSVQLPLLQKFFFDIFMSLIDPIRR